MWCDIAIEFLSFTGVKIFFDQDASEYVPEIEEDLIFTKPKVPQGLNVLICNSPVKSFQSNVGNMEWMIVQLANQYPNLNIICTQEFTHNFSNIFFTDDLTERKHDECDLSKVGWLAQFCQLIVTKSSGPGTFAFNKKTANNPGIAWFGLTIRETELPWYGVNILARTLWSTESNEQSLLIQLENILQDINII
jgi:hypothetical protein